MNALNLYFALSGWIENLGVVPLLLLAALRFVPIFTFLASLLFLVTRVLDTIYKLPQFFLQRITYSKQSQKSYLFEVNISNLKYLSKIFFYVKTSIILGLISTQSPMAATQYRQDTITLARGELYRQHFDRMQKFSIGNKQVIKAKADGQYIIVKALAQGVSDLLIWQGKKSPLKLKIFVVSKKDEAKLQKLSLELKKLNLTFQIIGQQYVLSGQIVSLIQLEQLRSLMTKYSNMINIRHLTMSQELKRKNFQRFIIESLDLYGDELDCEPQEIAISCFDLPNSLSTKKFLQSKYIIEWKPTSLKHKRKQFLIKLKLYQFENLSGHHFSLGLYQAEGTLSDVISKSPLALINKNTIALKKSHFEFSTLAEPTIVGRLNHPIIVRLGSELPYINTNREGQTTTQWRFAGLSIDLKLKPWGDHLIIEYTNALSRPNQETIQSSKQASSIIVSPGQKSLIFNVGFLVTDEQNQMLPGLDAIPLLNKLFRSKGSSKVFKKVLGFIEVKEI